MLAVLDASIQWSDFFPMICASGVCGGLEGRELPGGSVAVLGCGVVGGEVVAALSFDGINRARKDERPPQTGA